MDSVRVRWLNGNIIQYSHCRTVRELQFAICNDCDCCVHEVVVFTADCSTPFGMCDPAPCPSSVCVVIKRDDNFADAIPTWEELLNAHKDDRAAFKRMCQQKIPPDTDLGPYFAERCSCEDVVAIAVLLEQFPQEDAFDVDKALTDAVHYARDRTVCTLLEAAGDRVQITERNRLFIRAVVRNAPAVGCALLTHNADPTAHCNEALLPLICTYARPDMALEYVSLVEALLTNPLYSLNVDARSRDGDSALILAIANYLPPVAYCLLERSADATLANERGMTALHMAALVGDSDMVVALVRHRADISVKDGRGVSAMDVAVDRRETKIVEQLVALGAPAPKKKKWLW